MTSKYVVAGVIGLGLLVATFAIFGLKVGLVLCVFLMYEAFTLVNKEPQDTISETFWKLSTKPLIPWLFGFAVGWAMGADHLNNPYAIAVIFFLSAHFFFGSQDTYNQYRGK